jgi:hypothetical protein
VARGYRDALAKPAPIAPEFKSALSGEDYLGFETASQAIGAMRSHPDWAQRWDVQDPQALGDLFAAHEATRATLRPSMYEANLNVEPHQLLDWDKPLSEQSPHVQDALSGKSPWPVRKTDTGYVVDYPDGQGGTYTSIPFDTEAKAQTAGQTDYESSNPYLPSWAALHRNAQGGDYRVSENAAAALNQAGIPGIKYLDAGSRAAGEGTSNYVMFDPNLIDIARKYAIPAMVTGGGAAGLTSGLLGDQGQPEQPGT